MKACRYRIEIWDKAARKYKEVYASNNYERTGIMFDKPYYSRHTRRLIRTDEQIMLVRKANQ